SRHHAGDLRGDPARACEPDPVWLALRAAGYSCLGGAVVFWYRACCRGPGHGPADLRVSTRVERSGASNGPGPALPRATDARTRALGNYWAGISAVTQRAIASALSSLDQLSDRAAVRPGQRWDRDQWRVPVPRLHLADHPRNPAWLCRWQADRHRRHFIAGHPAQPGPAATTGRLGRRRWRRRDRGYRVHRVPADRHSCL